MTTLSIKLSDIDLSYQDKVIFNHFNVTLSAEGISFIIGENGAGKTQLLRLIHGLVNPDSGQVIAPNTHQQAFLQQTPVLLNRNVIDNLLFIKGTSVCPSSYFEHHLADIIQQFHLEKLLTQPAYTLSGGQQKRLALARLFLQQADYYLLDEPTANIDYQNTQLIETSINHLIAKGKKVILATHDFFQIQRLFQTNRDEIFIIKNRQIIEHLECSDVTRLQQYFQ